jgi:hypothetical protein
MGIDIHWVLLVDGCENAKRAAGESRALRQEESVDAKVD